MTGTGLNWGDAAAAASGRLLSGAPTAAFGPVGIDSRAARPGSVFFALRGERFDAHAFLDARLAALCSGWVVRRGVRLPDARPALVLEVEDPQAALAAVAGAWRRRFTLPVVGVTGSNGKTTVKQMLRSVLEARGPVCATEGNLNNEIGLPLTVLGLSSEHRHAVIEMGASKRGDIAHLCSVAAPTAAVLTNVQPAHLEFFGDIEAVFHTKSELVEALPPGAPVALCADDERLSRLVPGLGDRAWTFGLAAASRVRVLPGPTPRLSLEGRDAVLPAAFAGSVHRLNAAAAAAMGLALGLGDDEVCAGLARYTPAPLRFAERRHASGARFVLDAYNANPGSMRAGLSTFLETSGEAQRCAVLGDMRELGKDSARLHAELGAWLAGLPLAAVFLTGPESAPAAEALRAAQPAFPVAYEADPAALSAALKARLKPGVAVYFKASRAVRLEALADSL
ncbi:MAG: UDP-N-acetylmuramoyl-tripeptide--D-alanyl-D-alanine ligase [Elusimicrobia bacterium]|nr:UDP-N-acetylmuramoyl-tripeptide--D-alanyl-D-alanine ligase [Elusimicrobiota bacterium]